MIDYDEFDEDEEESRSAYFGAEEGEVTISVFLDLDQIEPIFQAIRQEDDFWWDVINLFEETGIDRTPEGVTQDEAEEISEAMAIILGSSLREGVPLIGCLPRRLIGRLLDAVKARCGEGFAEEIREKFSEAQGA